jgi:hypothetical protein
MSILYFSCQNATNNTDNENNTDDQNNKVIDAGLIGYWWGMFRYNESYGSNYPPNYFYFYGFFDDTCELYKFTQNTFSKCSYKTYIDNNKFIAEKTIKAYSKDGFIYSYENNEVLFGYETNAYPSDLNKDYEYAVQLNLQWSYLTFGFLQSDAENGKIIAIKQLDGSVNYYISPSSKSYGFTIKE